jgi:hypothetical protein
MKMVTLEVNVLAEDDQTGEDVRGQIQATLDMVDVEWLETTLVSERPYATEE